jgi:hypothetical protein
MAELALALPLLCLDSKGKNRTRLGAGSSVLVRSHAACVDAVEGKVHVEAGVVSSSRDGIPTGAIMRLPRLFAKGKGLGAA